MSAYVCVCVHLYEYACVHESDHKLQRIIRHAFLCLVCHPLPLKEAGSSLGMKSAAVSVGVKKGPSI